MLTKCFSIRCQQCQLEILQCDGLTYRDIPTEPCEKIGRGLSICQTSYPNWASRFLVTLKRLPYWLDPYFIFISQPFLIKKTWPSEEHFCGVQKQKNLRNLFFNCWQKNFLLRKSNCGYNCLLLTPMKSNKNMTNLEWWRVKKHQWFFTRGK